MRKYLPPARGFDHSLTVYYGQADHYDHSIVGVERIRALREGMPPAARPVDLHRDSVRKRRTHLHVLAKNNLDAVYEVSLALR